MLGVQWTFKNKGGFAILLTYLWHCLAWSSYEQGY